MERARRAAENRRSSPRQCQKKKLRLDRKKKTNSPDAAARAPSMGEFPDMSEMMIIMLRGKI